MSPGVVFDPKAQADLDSIFEWIAEHGGLAYARAFASALEGFCRNLALFPRRGSSRDDLGPGIRTIGFRRSAAVVFAVLDQQVTILRILYRGRSLETALDEP